MEVEEIQTQGSKFPRIIDNSRQQQQQQPSDFIDNNNSNEHERGPNLGINTTPLGRFCGWPASRIVRVSRASGGKDRHSKVWTSKGLRDRRVRLSVHTAIQFYDLQDRLGYDQPSKAVEWLLKAAARSIDELPSINTSFPDTPEQRSGEVDVEVDAEPVDASHAHSSNSETSKGSGGVLSLSRSENRVKARERAKERREKKEKEKEVPTSTLTPTPRSNHYNSQSSFTELLTSEGASLFDKQRQWGSVHVHVPHSPMDYFPMGQYHSQIHHPNNQELQHFSLLSDHMTTTGSTDLNFTMCSSSSSSGNMNRGTLQSNNISQHSMLLPQYAGSGVPYFIGTAASTADNNHNQYSAGLQLCYGDENGRHLDNKGKGKN